jgi:biotin carboxyl carrier protein
VSRYTVTIAGQRKLVEIHEQDGVARVVVDGRPHALEVRGRPSVTSRYHWLDGDRVVSADVDAAAGGKLSVTVAGETFPVEVADARVEAAPALAGPARPAGPVAVRAPMPGRVVKLLVRAGEEVKAGRGVVVVEAMKMENEIKAPRDGKVRALHVAEGAAVEAGEELAVLD